MGKTRIDLTGNTYGRLTVLRFAGITEAKKSKWVCACQCGNEKEIIYQQLVDGKSQSCGCLHKDTMRKKLTTHGLTFDDSIPDAYTIWVGMKQRCLNRKSKYYNDYGGRGIKICETWLSSFPAFIADMGDRPSLEHSIDRKDTNGNYEPSNCRWATKEEQSRNTRRNVKIEFKGETKLLCEWAETLNMSPNNLRIILKSKNIDYVFANIDRYKTLSKDDFDTWLNQ